MIGPILEILVRTRGRPAAYGRMIDSVRAAAKQFPGRILVHALCDGPEALEYVRADKVTRVAPRSGAAYPPNGYYAQALHRVAPSAWVLHLDDDDAIVGDLSCLVGHMGDPGRLLLWRARVGGLVLPPQRLWGHEPQKAHVSGIAFAVHRSRWTPWPEARAGDFAVISALYRRLKPTWVDRLLTAAQGPPGRGACLDLDAAGRPLPAPLVPGCVDDASSRKARRRAAGQRNP